jgi:CRISPR/Cas system-associated exonuclease Cas4 (RecB family)
MDPLVRGKLFHEVVAEVLRGADLDEALDRISAQYQDELAPAIPAVWAAEVERMRADLRGWVRQRRSEPAWTPMHVEWEFEVEVEGYRLKGVVDLIEERGGVLRAVDHKTGTVPQPLPQTTGAGEVLQPVLYALAAEKALATEVAGGRLSYATARQNYRTIDVPLNDFARANARAVLRTVDEALGDGFLPAAPRKDACESCDYRCVCGPYEEERVRRKPHIPALTAIRRTR